MPRSHVVIAGTGRAGTTFLVRLLTRLGLDTGFDKEVRRLDGKPESYLEHDVYPGMPAAQLAHLPVILKDPKLSLRIGPLVDGGTIGVRCVFVPIREIRKASESRIRGGLLWLPTRKHPGRLEKTGQQLGKVRPPPGETAVDVQDRKHYEVLGILFADCALRDIPIKPLQFPRIADDPDYAFAQLREVLGDITRARFVRVHKQTSNPARIHR